MLYPKIIESNRFAKKRFKKWHPDFDPEKKDLESM
jgi:hypothetical protein